MGVWCGCCLLRGLCRCFLCLIVMVYDRSFCLCVFVDDVFVLCVCVIFMCSELLGDEMVEFFVGVDKKVYVLCKDDVEMFVKMQSTRG